MPEILEVHPGNGGGDLVLVCSEDGQFGHLRLPEVGDVCDLVVGEEESAEFEEAKDGKSSFDLVLAQIQ